MLTRGDEEQVAFERTSNDQAAVAISNINRTPRKPLPLLVILELVSSCFWVSTYAKEGLASLSFFGLGSGVFL